MKQLLLHSFLIYCAVATYAMAQDGDPFYDKQPANSIHEQQVYFKENAEENINPATGGLTIVATDINLPGRNGLDLMVKRVFRGRHRIVPERTIDKRFSEFDYIPQYCGLGTGWKCFMGFFQIHTPIYPKMATLYLGDGQVSTFYTPDDGGTYYASTADKQRVIMTSVNGRIRPVLYFPDGRKYIFEMQTSFATWGYKVASSDQSFCLTKIEDANGNYISIHYLSEDASQQTCPRLEVDYIVDTWGRTIDFIWENDRAYTAIYHGVADPNPPPPEPFDLGQKYRLKQLDIICNGQAQKSYKYYYDEINVGYSEHLGGLYPAGRSKWEYNGQVTTLKAVFTGDKCIVRYDYGACNGYYDYGTRFCYPYGPSLITNPNPASGQLTKIIYPGGGYTQYSYRLVLDYAINNVYSVVQWKGNQYNNKIDSFDYRSDLDGEQLCNHCYFWQRTMIYNKITKQRQDLFLHYT